MSVWVICREQRCWSPSDSSLQQINSKLDGMIFAGYTLAAIASIAFVVWSTRRESRGMERRLQEAFSGRESLNSEAFYDRYFLDLGVAPEGSQASEKSLRFI